MTLLLSRIANQLYNDFRSVGVLIINQEHSFRINHYLYDVIYNHKSKDFKIPYFIEGVDREKSILETAAYIDAAFGLNEKLKMTLTNLMMEEGPPKLLSDLLDQLSDYIFNVNNKLGIETLLFPGLPNMLRNFGVDPILAVDSEIPEWFEAWKAGAKAHNPIT